MKLKERFFQKIKYKNYSIEDLLFTNKINIIKLAG